MVMVRKSFSMQVDGPSWKRGRLKSVGKKPGSTRGGVFLNVSTVVEILFNTPPRVEPPFFNEEDVDLNCKEKSEEVQPI